MPATMKKSSTRKPAAAEPPGTSAERLAELGAALTALNKELKQAAGTPSVGGGRRPLPQQAFVRLADIVGQIQAESGLPARPRLVMPPRVVVPRFEPAPDAPAPKVVELGGDGRLKMGVRALTLGVPGLAEVNLDEEGGVSVSTPVGGVTIDGDGIAVDAGDAGKASAGKDGVSAEAGGDKVTVGPGGASVTIPGFGTIGASRDGGFTYTPGDGGGGGAPGTPAPIPHPAAGGFTIPIPIPHFEAKPLEIPIPVPKFVAERFEVPVPLPKLELPPLPDLREILKELAASADERFQAVAAKLEEYFKTKLELAAALVAKDPMVDAVAQALALWQVQARLQKLTVTTVTAVGGPGCLSGPDLLPLLEATVPVAATAGDERKFARAAARGVARNFELWMDKVTVPGLPWYPAFAAWPGPVAPPTPNVPTPLSACVSAEVAAIVMPPKLEAAIRGELPAALRAKFELRTRIVAGQLAAWFGQWLAQRMVMLVMGQGPVPAFAPPVSPVGPVVGGTAEGLPGCVV